VADGELQPKGTAAGVLQTRRDCARARVCPQRAWYLGPTTRALCATGFRLQRWRLAVGVLAAHTIDLHRHGSVRQLGRSWPDTCRMLRSKAADSRDHSPVWPEFDGRWPCLRGGCRPAVHDLISLVILLEDP
jgi:hypothetical protein